MKLKHMASFLVLSASTSAFALPVTFVFNYTDAAGTGFYDADLGAKRRADLEAAGSLWGQLLSASYAGETINIGASFNAASTSLNPLSAASATNVYANGQMDNKGLTNVVYTAPLAEHLAGRNLNGGAMDYTLSFNPNLPTHFGTDAPPGASEYDFYSYSLRAVARTLGFNTRLDLSATATQGTFFTQYDTNTGTYIQMPGIYDSFLREGSGKSWVTMTSAERIAADTHITQTSNDSPIGALFWTGANAVAQHANMPLRVNGMPIGSDGRLNGNAIIYLDQSNTTLMTYLGIQPGQTMGLDSQTAGMMMDMGWHLSVPLPVPEPSSYAMLLAGLGMIGFAARRRMA